MPVFILTLTNPSFYMAAIMKTVGLAQQAGETDARSRGRELIGPTLMGAWNAALKGFGLSMSPSLWMLVLWLVAAALWAGSGIFRTRRKAFRPSFRANALATTFLRLGPAIKDSGGQGRFLRFIGLRDLVCSRGFYAWGMIWLLERCHAVRVRPLPFEPN